MKAKKKSERLPGPYDVRVTLSEAEARAINRLIDLALWDDTEYGNHHIQKSARESMREALRRFYVRRQERTKAERERNIELARDAMAV